MKLSYNHYPEIAQKAHKWRPRAKDRQWWEVLPGEMAWEDYCSACGRAGRATITDAMWHVNRADEFICPTCWYEKHSRWQERWWHKVIRVLVTRRF